MQQIQTGLPNIFQNTNSFIHWFLEDIYELAGANWLTHGLFFLLFIFFEYLDVQKQYTSSSRVGPMLDIHVLKLCIL